MASLKGVRILLKNLAYEVIVSKLSEGCVVVYPTSEINSYTISSDGFIVCDNDLNKKVVVMPDYGVRPAIMTHIISKCLDISYDPRMIGFYVGEKRVKSLESILVESFEKEDSLCDILFDGLKNGFSLVHYKSAKYNNVEEAYEKILELVENAYE